MKRPLPKPLGRNPPKRVVLPNRQLGRRNHLVRRLRVRQLRHNKLPQKQHLWPMVRKHPLHLVAVRAPKHLRRAKPKLLRQKLNQRVRVRHRRRLRQPKLLLKLPQPHKKRQITLAVRKKFRVRLKKSKLKLQKQGLPLRVLPKLLKLRRQLLKVQKPKHPPWVV